MTVTDDPLTSTTASSTAAAANTANPNTTVAPFLSKHIPQQHAIQQKGPTGGNKYCYRHQPDVTCRRQADEFTMEQLQKDLENLPAADQEAISHVWSVFSAAPATQRNLILRGILSQCCSSQLSLISCSVRELIRIDFLVALPTELAFKVLSYLDTQSLCKAAQVSRQWRLLADDDVVWHKMCKQHIDRKCTKCGWGLPLLERKRLRAQPQVRKQFFEQQVRQGVQRQAGSQGGGNGNGGARLFLKRDLSALSLESDADGDDAGVARGLNSSKKVCRSTSDETVRDSSPDSESASGGRRARHWKDIYSERYKVESNWRRGRCTKKVFKGHTNGIMCLQFDDSHLATGSYDATIKLWHLETGKELRTLSGHTSGVRALQFDDSKLISGSMDNTLKIWNWKTGDCVRTLGGHTAGVVCLHFHGDLLVSGSVDCTIRGWNFRTGDRFVLKGHGDWVNSVRIHLPSNTLFSASDDTTVRIWDLESKRCLRTFAGHVGQVQQVIPMSLDPSDFEPLSATIGAATAAAAAAALAPAAHQQRQQWEGQESLNPLTPSHIITAALDSQVRVWDVAQGKCVRTLFGHIEGVWALAADSLRVISGAEDRLVKVWDLRTAKCQRTVADHAAAVTCVQLSDSRMISGSEDGEAWMYCFRADDVSSSSTQRKGDPMEVVGSETDDS